MRRNAAPLVPSRLLRHRAIALYTLSRFAAKREPPFDREAINRGAKFMIPKTIDRDDWQIALWRFDTARFTVALFAEPEHDDPADSFCDPHDVEFAREDNEAHWFCAAVVVYDEHGKLIGSDYLGACSYHSFREFYSAHRWQYSRRQGKWITDPRSRAWKALDARRPRRPDGTRMDGHCFPDMVRETIREAKAHLLTLQHTYLSHGA